MTMETAALVTLSLLTAFLLVLTLLPISRSEVWWIRGGDFPRSQFAGAGVLLLGLQLIILRFEQDWQWLLPALTLACVLYQLWWIWPYSRLHGHEVKKVRNATKDRRVRIMVANVLMSNDRTDLLLEILRKSDPDIVVLLETNAWWESRLAVLDADYPHCLKCPLENKYGMHLYSRLPLHDAQIRFLVEPDFPSMHALVTLPSGDRFRLHALHPAPPSPTENETSRERDAELVMVGKKAAKSALPVIVTGDMNDVAWSATTRLFRKVSGLLDPRIGRGMFNTFHAGHTFMRWPLDHLFHSCHFTLVDIRRLEYFGSDHFPILVELALEPQRAGEQNGLCADGEDLAWADEKIAAKSSSSSDSP